MQRRACTSAEGPVVFAELASRCRDGVTLLYKIHSVRGTMPSQ